MESRESGVNRDNSANNGWESLKSVPFNLLGKNNQTEERRKQARERRKQEEEAQKRRAFNAWVDKVSADPYAQMHEEKKGERKVHENKIDAARSDKIKLGKEIADEREKRNGYFKTDRVQELVERDFNAILTTEEKLQEAIENGDDGIEERTIDYQGENIPVYALKGLNFSLLVHDMNFRGNPDHPAHWLSRKNIEDPSNWAKTVKEAKQSDKWGSTSGEGNMISASFLSPMTLGIRGEDSPLIYGFSHVEARSLVDIAPNDGATGNMGDDGHISLQVGEVDAARERATLKEKQTMYDEIQLRRYSDIGEPKKPDFIVVRNGKITDTVLKHAAFWKIPIIAIDKAAYDDNNSVSAEKVA